MSGSLKEIHQQVCDAASELCEKSEIPAGTLFVVGCSSSEISGHAIGAQPAPIVGKTVVDALLEVLQPRGIHLVAQCCEHLNRALVVEREVMVGRWWAEEVNAGPSPPPAGLSPLPPMRLLHTPCWWSPCGRTLASILVQR